MPHLCGLPGSHSGLKSLYTWQYTHPGKKLLFMGQEFAMDREWDVREGLDWELAQKPSNCDVTECIIRLLFLICYK